MPKLIDEKHCPHCGAELPEPKPRMCPQCAGSLQQRYLKTGCLTSAPRLVVLGIALWALWRAIET